MKRWASRFAVGIVFVAIAVGALFAYRVWQRQRGRPVPACGAPALRRDSFESPRAAVLPQDAFGDDAPFSGLPFVPGRSFTEVTAALAPDGSLLAAFLSNDSRGDPNRLITERIPLEGPWKARALSSDRSSADDPTLAVDSAGVVHLAWLGHDSGSPEKHMEIAYATSADGLSWSPPVEMHAPSDCAHDARACLDEPRLTAVPGGLSLLYHSASGTPALKAVRLEHGRPERSVEVTRLGATASTTVDARGVLHVAYVAAHDAKSQYGDPAAWVELRRSEDGGITFGEPVRVSAQGASIPLLFSGPQVAADADRGVLYVAYPAGGPDLAWDIELSSSKDGGKSWHHTRVNDDPRCANHMMPMMQLDPVTGAVHLAWLENRSGQGQVAYARCEPGGERCTTNEAISRVFTPYGLRRDEDDWLGDHAAMVLDAKRRWLHVLWAEPSGQNGNTHTFVMYSRAKLR